MNENVCLQDPIPEAINQEPTPKEEAMACDQEDTATQDTDALLPLDGQAPDPVAEAMEGPALQDQMLARMDALAGELAELKATMRRQNNAIAYMEAECEEFSSLYPQTPLDSIPDAVWRDVKRGIPIAAAYALDERRRLCRDRQAEQCNALNQMRSAGSVDGTENNYFTPAEVRAMTPTEVRKHYRTIMQSMSKWH